ncbi:MAG: hypothetical protein ABIL09_28355 [Gemmatimonadota bacterium]
MKAPAAGQGGGSDMDEGVTVARRPGAWVVLALEVLLLGWAAWALQHYFQALGFVDLFRQLVGKP